MLNPSAMNEAPCQASCSPTFVPLFLIGEGGSLGAPWPILCSEDSLQCDAAGTRVRRNEGQEIVVQYVIAPRFLFLD